jgi:chorismate mutase/prephenate dehydratase
MSGSFALERPPRIAYLGPPGSFSHLAATRKFGASVEHVALDSISAIFDEVERDRVELGLVPIENSTGGGVTDTLEVCDNRDLCVCAEIHLAVHLHLFGRGSLERIESVHSKPEAFAQCRKWLSQHGLSSNTISAPSTSRAVEIAAADPTAAAIGSRLAGELHHIPSLADNIEDNPHNVTRFWVLSKTPAKPTGDDKTAIHFQAADRPGSLVEALDAFRAQNVNMTFIQSRAAEGKGFDYAFFVDIAGHANDANVAQAIQTAREHCTSFKILGSFPRAKETL